MKKKKKQIIISVILVISIVCFGIFHYLKNTHAYSTDTKSSSTSYPKNGYNTGIKVTGPNGTSTIWFHVQQQNSTEYTGGTFNDASRGLKFVMASTSSPNPYNLKLASTTTNTIKNSSGNYARFTVKVSYSVPAHYQHNGLSWDSPSATSEAYNISGTAGHSSSSHTVTSTLRMSVYNTGVTTYKSGSKYYRYHGCSATININKRNNYTLYYNANGGSCSTGSKTIACGGTYGTLPTATRTGYSLVGWNTSSTATTSNVSSSTTLCNGNKTIYAIWKEDTYNIAFHGNGSSGTMNNVTLSCNKDNALPASTFTRQGYTFLGWSTDPEAVTAKYKDRQSVSALAGKGNTINLYAVWRKSDADFDTSNIIHDDKMFTGDVCIEGGNGTGYNNSKTDSEYARIDRAGIQGYFTNRW